MSILGTGNSMDLARVHKPHLRRMVKTAKVELDYQKC